MAWLEFIAAFGMFFLSHSVPVRPPMRDVLVGYLGLRGFTFVYSLLSLAILAWLIGAAARAPYVELWPWMAWQNHLVLAALALVFLVLAETINRPNPFSFGGARNEQFNPDRPGIVRLHRHPLLLALGVWAFAHVLPNGDLAHVILFGVFGGFALLGQKIIDRRKQRQMGADWQALLDQTQQTPLRLNLFSPKRLSVAAVLFGISLWLHPLLIGVSPLP